MPRIGLVLSLPDRTRDPEEVSEVLLRFLDRIVGGHWFNDETLIVLENPCVVNVIPRYRTITANVTLDVTHTEGEVPSLAEYTSAVVTEFSEDFDEGVVLWGFPTTFPGDLEDLVVEASVRITLDAASSRVAANSSRGMLMALPVNGMMVDTVDPLHVVAHPDGTTTVLTTVFTAHGGNPDVCALRVDASLDMLRERVASVKFLEVESLIARTSSWEKNYLS